MNRTKKVLILSQEPWNFLFLSKQNYAIAFAERGYSVYYMTFPKPGIGWNFQLRSDIDHKGICLINYQIPIPTFLKFKAIKIYRLINQKWIEYYLLGKYKLKFDLVVDFGFYYYLLRDLKWTKAKVNVFFPVDNSDLLPVEYKGVNAIFSVSDLILDKYKNGKVPTYLIQHGLAKPFVDIAKESLELLSETQGKYNDRINKNRFKIGYIGNLNFHFLDRDLLLRIVSEVSQCDFHFYGRLNENEDKKFYHDLLSNKNVYYNGQKSSTELAQCMKDCDAFFMCYTRKCNEEISGNSHKIMEYLSTGKVLFTTYIKIFEDFDFIQMTNPESRNDLPRLIAESMLDISFNNSPKKQIKRISYALQHTYTENVHKIERLIGLE